MQGSLQVSDAILGRTLALAGQTQAGMGYVEAALAIGKDLVKFDPSHLDWKDDYAYYSALLGQLWLEQGDVEAAAPPIGFSIATLTALVAKDPGNTQWLGNLAEAQLQGARLALARKHRDAARRLAEAALKNLAKPLKDNPSSALSIRIEANIELTLGQLADEAGDGAAAAKYRQQALARVRPMAARSSDPRTLALLVDALLASGQDQDATPHVLALQKTGYRPVGFIATLRRHGIDYPADPQLNARVAQLLHQNGPGPHVAAAHP